MATTDVSQIATLVTRSDTDAAIAVSQQAVMVTRAGTDADVALSQIAALVTRDRVDQSPGEHPTFITVG